MARSTRLTVVADTGALYAMVDASDVWHSRVVEWWKTNASDVVVPTTVLPEVTYLLQSRIGSVAEEAFVSAVVNGDFLVEPLEPEDITRAAALMRRFADLPLGFVDATIVATAERLEAREILTTDRRHFSVVRPKHAQGTRLVP